MRSVVRIGILRHLGTVALGITILTVFGTAAPQDQAQVRLQAIQFRQQGNWKEALELFRQLGLEPMANPAKVHEDVEAAIECMNQLRMMEELDEFLMAVVDQHADQWRVLAVAAKAILQAPHHGVVSSNIFRRAPQRNDTGSWVFVQDQDRQLALSWLSRAIPLVEKEADKSKTTNFYAQLAQTLLERRSGQASWLLQARTDLEKAPNYIELEATDPSQASRFAPVDVDGKPILYSAAVEWNQSQNDGQRLRWAIERWSATQPTRALLYWAEFLNGQFGVETLANDRLFYRVQSSFADDASEKPANEKTGVYALHTLEDNETIARLANGIQRIDLPDEFNPLRIYQRLIKESSGDPTAFRRLVDTYSNRRQYSKAADICRLAIQSGLRDDTFPPLLANIVMPRGRFDMIDAQPAGKPATLGFVFRNADQASFTAAKVDVEKLLTDVKQFYRAHRPDQPPIFAGKKRYPPDIVDPSSIFSSIAIDQYLQGKVAEWSLDLQARENHWDRRIQVATPLQQAGLYVVTAKLQKPEHVSRCLVWIHDTSIVRKQLDNKILYYVADAISGQPVPNATLEFFGFAHEFNNGRPQPVKIANFAKKASLDGQIIVDASELPSNYQWQVVARASGNRMATLGMEHLWYNAFSQQEDRQLKAYGVSDRPAYRPGEVVNAKFWIALAGYSVDIRGGGNSLQAKATFPVQLTDPQGTAIWTGIIETDRFGGGSIELTIPKDAKLGAYHFQIQNANVPTNLMIRVEEYRKPEFEVTIEAPKTPIQLGEKFQASILAKYYFGSPVAGATANVTITRTAYRDSYYPIRPFDWCYGAGYWWNSYDLDWYPGWRRWNGCVRPLPWWLPRVNEEPPELVLQQEITLDAQGQAAIDVDSSLALAFQSDSDHRYKIDVDVRDASRRTLRASGQVIAARQAFKIYSWSDRGYYQAGDKIVASFQARTLGGKGVACKGKLELLRISYDAKRAPIESVVDTWEVATDAEGNLEQALQAGRSGQYRLKLTLVDDAEHSIEGGCMITVRGDEMQGADFRFNALELIPDKSEYSVGDQVRLQINADRDDALVWLFIRPQGSVYPLPQKVQLRAKTAIVEIPIVADDQPNFFVEALTIYDGNFHQETREIIVPPQQRVLDVSVATNKDEYLPGEEAEVEIVVKGIDGEPVEGSVALAVYDRALDQIAPDAIPPDIREFFWKWRRQHHPHSAENLSRRLPPIYLERMPSADPLGIFGASMADDAESIGLGRSPTSSASMSRFGRGGEMAGKAMMEGMSLMSAAPMAMAESDKASQAIGGGAEAGIGQVEVAQPAVRTAFADAAYWVADIDLDRSGKSIAKFKLPENLTSWRIGVWSMASGVRVGSGTTQALTRKNLMVRLQTPRFLVDRDEVIASALVNNDFDESVQASVELKQEGDFLSLIEPESALQTVTIPAHGQQRIDWRCRAVKPGEATLRVTAVSSRESDAMEMKLPVVVNGILKTDSYAGTVRPEQALSTIDFTVPETRIVDQSRLTIRVSPSLAMSMVDALPYMVDYPHGCTEQTLNRFVPTVITHQTLIKMGIDLKKLQESRVNLNAQELGEPADRAARWKRFERNPVFDNAEVESMVQSGLRRLTEMQLSDGGWGWFSGLGEHSWPHTTAVVVRGLLAAKAADAAIVPDCLSRGLDWMVRYQNEQLQLLENASSKKKPYKVQPDDLDAFVFHVLVMADRPSVPMQSYLYEKRNGLSVHSKALLAMATHRMGDIEQTRMLRQNIEQFLVQDDENETAFLRDQSPWWYWYGSSIEATANYLKLLIRLEPQSPITSRLVKYLLNNRKHATYWSSTRDTALVIEAFAEYLTVTQEGMHDVQADLFLDGQSLGSLRFTPQTLFETNNSMELFGAAIKPGAHRLEIRRVGQGPLYWNVYQTNFTQEERIAPAGLEVKVDRRYYRLDPLKKELWMAGDRGQIGEGERTAYQRVLIPDLSEVPSGQLIEVELLIESKNDYEYIMLRDPKAASFEPIDTQSGYHYHGGLSIYREFRDQYVGMFLRTLPRGSHSIRYQVRCEAPGRFTALPATALGMYAPELVGNSADFDAVVVDR